ncbi:MAG: tRNA pseudouridine(55) synthase TruB [Verrucomicrobiota bacterium]|nr:tRNA pseudouridine(55) synthase TruB [Verrucomicrobiota bacterium]
MNAPFPHHPRRFGSPQASNLADALDGVLLVDKPSGPTSHDVVDMIRRRFKLDKVGHGGTLDPQATGLLIILLGRGTKLSGQFLGSDKTYEGLMRLGVATDSHDADGKVVREADCGGVTRDRLEAEMRKLHGDILQIPPMVSAAKVDGMPLYKAARKGRTVERKAKTIRVYEFALRTFTQPTAAFFMRCSKGTYVRTLCADIGDALGCGAHLASLRRLACGRLRVEDAVSAAEVAAMSREELRAKMLPLSSFAAAMAGLGPSPV